MECSFSLRKDCVLKIIEGQSTLLSMRNTEMKNCLSKVHSCHVLPSTDVISRYPLALFGVTITEKKYLTSVFQSPDQRYCGTLFCLVQPKKLKVHLSSSSSVSSIRRVKRVLEYEGLSHTDHLYIWQMSRE